MSLEFLIKDFLSENGFAILRSQVTNVYTLKAKNFGLKHFGQNIFGHFSKLFRMFPEKFRTHTKTMYLVIFNALKRYLKVNSFKFV